MQWRRPDPKGIAVISDPEGGAGVMLLTLDAPDTRWPCRSVRRCGAEATVTLAVAAHPALIAQARIPLKPI